MEVTEYNSDTVHVLRQGFLPNQPFRDALSSLVEPGHITPRLFSAWGTLEREIPVTDVVGSAFMQEKHRVDQQYEQRRHMLVQPSAELGARMLQATIEGKSGNVALQLVMKPTNFIEFSNLQRTLGLMKLGRQRHAFGFTATRLYIDIPFEALRDVDQVKKGLNDIRAHLPQTANAHSLYQLTPDERIHGEFKMSNDLS